MLHAGCLFLCVAGLTVPPQVNAAEDTATKVVIQTNTEKIPYEVVFRLDRSLRSGQIKRAQVGAPGYRTSRLRVTYADGKKVDVQLLSTVTAPAKSEVYLVGDNNRLSTRGDFTRSQVLEMSASAYCAKEFVRSGHNSYATATGAKAIRGVAAVDPRVIPLRSILYIEGYGLAIAADTGGGIKGKKIDLCMNTMEEMRAWGRKTVRVHILGR